MLMIFFCVNWIFYIGIKFRDFITIAKDAKLKTRENEDSRTSRYGHLSNTDTSPLRAASNVPTKFSYILFKKTSIIRSLYTDNGHQISAQESKFT